MRATRFAGVLVLVGAGACASAAGPPTAGMPPVIGPERSLRDVTVVDVAEGTGGMAEPNRCVFVHYTGWRSNGRQFETSRAGDPVAFMLGIGQVMRGWDIGIAGMKVGGMRRLFIPSHLAYGEKGRPPLIPPGAPLVFDTELIAVSEATAASGCPSWKEMAARRDRP